MKDLSKHVPDSMKIRNKLSFEDEKIIQDILEDWEYNLGSAQKI